MKKRTMIEGFWQRMNAVMEGKNKNELAKRIGCDRKTLYGNDGTLSPVYLARFCAITGTDANWLLGITTENIPTNTKHLKNERIRIAMIQKNLKQYEVAKILGIHESVLCRKLREELPDEEQDEIIAIIEERGDK